MPNQNNGKGFGLLFEMGCGKTLTAIAIMGALYQRGKVKRALVVAPTTVVPVWPEELAEKAAFPFEAATMLGSKSRRLKAYREMKQAAKANPGSLELVAINYNEIWRDGIQELLEEFQPDMMILDEGHYIKTHTSKVSKAACELGSKAKYRLLLTGTPVTNTATDLFGEFRYVDQNVYGGNFYRFRNRYCVMGGFQNRVVVGEKNKEELIRKLHSVSLRVTKADALDLPEETSITRYVELSKSEKDIYEQLRKTGLAELEGENTITAAIVITKLLRMQQVCGGFAQLDGEEKPRQVGTSKLDALSEIIQEVVVDGKKKLVIFARFLPEVKAICDLLEGQHIRHEVIYGEIPQEQRGEIVSRFQSDPGIMVFVAQIQTAGLGITLHAASTAVFYSADYNYANYAQAMARIHRIGQKQPCTYINLISRGTVDENIQKALNTKGSLADGICDHWRELFIKEGTE